MQPNVQIFESFTYKQQTHFSVFLYIHELY